MKKIGGFFHKIGSDVSKIHARAAFADVEHRVEKFFHHTQKTKEEHRKSVSHDSDNVA